MQLIEKIKANIDTERLIHSIKTALACLIGYGIFRALDLQTGKWLVITIIVVMCAQINVGGVLQKSYMRFLGTLAGAIISALTILYLGDGLISNAIVVLLSAMLFSAIATSTKSYSDSGTLGAVTVAVILVAPHPTIMDAGSRFLEISCGIIIATLISQFILPIHARNHLRRTQAETIRQIKEYYQHMLTNQQPIETAAQIELDGAISKTLIAQRKLATDAKREMIGEKFNIDLFKQSLWYEKEILRSITSMHSAYLASEQAHTIISQIPALSEFHQGTLNALEEIASQIEHQQSENIDLPQAHELLKNLNEAAESVMSSPERIHIDSFSFGIQSLIDRITKLSSLHIK